jgi:FkbM family methyltransferase
VGFRNNVTVIGGSRKDVALARFLATTIGRVVRVRGLGAMMRPLQRNGVYTVVRLEDDTVFVYPTYDAYWSYFHYVAKEYETVLREFFERISHLEFGFLDCGANFGYWSALLSGKRLHSHRTVAVEASNETIDGLRLTGEMNESRFTVLHNAVYGTSDMTVSFSEGERHAGRHIMDGRIERNEVNRKQLFTPRAVPSPIRTITIDDLMRTYFGDGSVIVKLDIEGAEIDAFEGARAALEQDILFLYEDFANDMIVTEYLFDNGFRLYYPKDLTPIKTFSAALTLRRQSRNNNDYLAIKGDGRLAREVIALGAR